MTDKIEEPAASAASAPVEESTTQGDHPEIIVGVGASAGGLEALESFFEQVPEGSKLVFVVIQHLSPDFESMMEELLARRTSLPIQRAKEGMRLESGHIYLIPPRTTLTVDNGCLNLEPVANDGSVRHPIDDFFVSMAKEYCERSAAVVLSGTGTDGAYGVRLVKESGGVVLAQEESSAQFSGMPHAAIATGMADHVMLPRDMPELLESLHSHYQGRVGVSAEHEERPVAPLDQVVKVLQRETGVDYSFYKRTTLARRIDRRLAVLRLSTLQEYQSALIENPGEAHVLARDLLIGVTRFFRDEADWEGVRQFLKTKIQAGKALRIWSAACSTGEEAYSLAILVREIQAECDILTNVKIFASDLEESAIAVASEGKYAAGATSGLSKERLHEHFTPTSEGFRVKRSVRELIVFIHHNLVSDPPFTKIDLVLCRNMLIYAQPEYQRRMLGMLHFSLVENGVLFLGTSENVTPLADAFEPIREKSRLYRKKPGVYLNLARREGFEAMLHRERRRGGTGFVEVDQELEGFYAHVFSKVLQPSMLLTEDMQLRRTFQDMTGILAIPKGELSSDVIRLIHDDLRSALVSACASVRKRGKLAAFKNVRVNQEDGSVQAYDLTVHPVPVGHPTRSGLLVQFDLREEQILLTAGDESGDDEISMVARLRDLEDELEITKENLQASVEELETSNEELQSANEELLASNEELQSTNEELQSVNEELHTVNTEHQVKIEELVRLNHDFENLLNATDIGTIFLDRDLRIRRYTPAVLSSVKLVEHDLGRPLEHFQPTLPDCNLVDNARAVLTGGKERFLHTRNSEGHALLVKFLPFEEDAERVTGVVITFVDVNEIEDARVRIRESERRFELVEELASDGFWDADLHTQETYYSPNWFRALGYKEGELPSTLETRTRLIHPDDRGIAQEAYDLHLSSSEPFDLPLRMQHARGHYVWMKCRAQVIRDKGSNPIRMVGTHTDITALRNAQGHMLVSLQAAGMGTWRWSSDTGEIELDERSATLLGEEVQPGPMPLEELLSFVSEGDREDLGARIRSVETSQESIQAQFYLTDEPTIPGIRISLHGRFDPISNRVLGVLWDSTSEEQMEREREQTSRALLRVNRELREFASLAAHDLKAPARHIAGFVSMLRDQCGSKFDEAGLGIMESIHERAKFMNDLITNLLAYSNAGVLLGPPTMVDLDQLSRQVVARHKAALNACSANIRIEDLPNVRGHRAPFEQVLENLITNSIKYRDPDRDLLIHIGGNPVVGGKLFYVTDNGRGIPEDSRDRAFGPFKRLARDGDKPGVGMGLAIVRKIVEAYGGAVSIQDGVDEGIRVQIELPDEGSGAL